MNVTALSNLRQIGVAARLAAGDNRSKLPATLDALTNQLVSGQVLFDPQSGKKFIYVAGGQNLAELPTNAVPAYSPADNRERAVLFADGQVATANGRELSDLINLGPPQLATADFSGRQAAGTRVENEDLFKTVPATQTVSGLPQAGEPQGEMAKANPQTVAASASEVVVASPPAAAPMRDRAERLKEPGANASLPPGASASLGPAAASYRLVSARQNVFQNTAIQTRQLPVLTNFQVQQNGNAIRVVDADGSVYNGSLGSEAAPVVNEPAPAEMPPATATAANAKDEQEKPAAVENKAPAMHHYFFRVAGMNQTLKQTVVFKGSLLAHSLPDRQQQPFGGGGSVDGQLSVVITNQLPWASSRISGTAIVAATNTVEINAMPVAP